LSHLFGGYKLKQPAQSQIREDNLRLEGHYDQEDVIDLREYITIIKKWRWVIALLTLCAVVTSGLISFFVLTPIYQTKSFLCEWFCNC
jgi:hypothetical protein